MKAKTDVNPVEAARRLDSFVESGFKHIQTRVDAHSSSNSGTMISNSPNRPPLLYAGDVASIADAHGVLVDVDLLPIIDAAVLRVRPNSTYVTSLGRDPKSGDPVVMLNNQW